MLDLLNVKYIFAGPQDELPNPHFTRIADGAARVFRNERVFPRAFLASRVRIAAEQADLDLIVSGKIDLRAEVILSDPLPVTERPDHSSTDDNGARSFVGTKTA